MHCYLKEISKPPSRTLALPLAHGAPADREEGVNREDPTPRLLQSRLASWLQNLHSWPFSRHQACAIHATGLTITPRAHKQHAPFMESCWRLHSHEKHFMVKNKGRKEKKSLLPVTRSSGSSVFSLWGQRYLSRWLQEIRYWGFSFSLACEFSIYGWARKHY